MDILTPEGRFQYSIGVILEHEGGLTDDPQDPGGLTNYGISLKFGQSIGLDAEDIRKMTPEKAAEIYRKYWWDQNHYAGFNDVEVVSKLFDISVNMGCTMGNMILQKAINETAIMELIPLRLTVDGVIGGKTINAANKLDPHKLRERLREGMKNRYLDILERHPRMEVFRKGWLKRAAW
jgi:lysozyme family protein